MFNPRERIQRQRKNNAPIFHRFYHKEFEYTDQLVTEKWHVVEQNGTIWSQPEWTKEPTLMMMMTMTRMWLAVATDGEI